MVKQPHQDKPESRNKADKKPATAKPNRPQKSSTNNTARGDKPARPNSTPASDKRGRPTANSKGHTPRAEQSKRARGPQAEPQLEQNSAGEKLQKVLARAGLGSRREMERAIESGSVKVNDRTAKLGDRVSTDDKVFFNGQRVISRAETSRRRVILYNKPEGQICSRSDPEGRPTVYDNLPPLQGERWISVGRLDFNTSGLLLFTTDGELANKLMHPSSVIDREYLVRIQGNVDDEMKQHLLEGVLLDDGVARFTDIVDGAGESRNRWFYCVVMEGRNREVRRLWESQGVKVSRLKRVRYANIFIPSHVRVGQWTELNDREIHDLCLTAGFDKGLMGKAAPPSRDEKAQLERHEKRLRAANSAPRRPSVVPRKKKSD